MNHSARTLEVKKYDELMSDLQSIEPVSTTTAGMASRAMAYIVDQVFLLFCLLPFAIVILLLRDKAFKAFQWMVPIIAFISLIVPAIYLTFIYRGWRSIGRYLFQLRIVEENGLSPRRQQMVTREVLRNAISWIGPLVIYLTLYYEGVGRWPDLALVLFVATDAALAIFRKDRQSLHDYLSRTRVVLATEKQSSSHYPRS
ncbi:MAG: RDD family protein [Pirellula sp.]|nr:RDD family protein [Pirellula sp.]